MATVNPIHGILLNSISKQTLLPQKTLVVASGRPVNELNQTINFIRSKIPSLLNTEFIVSQKKGLGMARNIGIENCKTEILIFGDDDDLWDKRRIEIIVKTIVFSGSCLVRHLHGEIIGNKKKISPKLKKILQNSEKITKNNNRLQINLALNYGSKDELLNTFEFLKKKKIKITLKNVNKNLYTCNIPDPDILIRTGNTKRLSNFMLWQLAYSEIYFEKKLWPDFTIKDYNRIISGFKKIKRNFGNI